MTSYITLILREIYKYIREYLSILLAYSLPGTDD